MLLTFQFLALIQLTFYAIDNVSGSILKNDTLDTLGSKQKLPTEQPYIFNVTSPNLAEINRKFLNATLSHTMEQSVVTQNATSNREKKPYSKTKPQSYFLYRTPNATQGREEPVSISQLNKRLAFAKREKKRLQDA